MGCLSLPYTCGNGSRRFLFMVAFFGFGVCTFFMGPSVLLNLKYMVGDKLMIKLMVSISFIMFGFLQVIIFIPIIPEMLERMQVAYKISEGENEEIDN